MPDSIDSVMEALKRFIEQTIKFIQDEDDVGAFRIAIVLTADGSKSASDLLKHHTVAEDLNDAARSPSTLLEAAILSMVTAADGFCRRDDQAA